MGSQVKICRKMSKCICCSLINLTIGCRIIAAIGIMVSLWLVIAFANDKFINNESNYDISRRTALVLGLDWQHFYSTASIKHEHDVEGKMISIIITFYSFAFLGMNLLLVVATLRYDWCFAIPWLLCEGLSFLSKLGSLFYHVLYNPYELGTTDFVGLGFNLILSFWFWLVVLFALISWQKQQNFDLEAEMYSLYSSSPKANSTEGTTFDGTAKMNTYKDSAFSTIDSNTQILV